MYCISSSNYQSYMFQDTDQEYCNYFSCYCTVNEEPLTFDTSLLDNVEKLDTFHGDNNVDHQFITAIPGTFNVEGLNSII
jgi:hypothetical protein